MRSGVPIKSAVAFRTITAPVIIPRKIPDAITGKLIPHMDPDDTKKPHPRTKRVYLGKNNHHIEIREKARKRKGTLFTEWIGEVVTAFEAAKRNAKRLKAIRDAGVPTRRQLHQMPKNERKQVMQRWKPVIEEISRRYPVVDRSDNDTGRFIMSLSEDETIHARRNDRNPDDPDAVGYYVVAKLDASRIWFAPHWDARSADEQDRWDVSYSNLKNCGPDSDKPPYKVRVSPLGEVTPLHND